MTAIFIRRPVMTALVMIGLLFFGTVAYRRLPVSDLPSVDFPTISVNANLPGASPETMAAAVATPLEKQFSTIAGIDNMTSQSSLGSASITIQFSLDRDIDAAAQDVQAAISQTLRSLPQGILPPSYRKVNPADQPILYFALTSKTLPLSQLDEYGETFMAQRISSVPGIAQVQVYGGQKYAVRVQLDPTSLANRSIGIDEVASAISAQNVSMPTGILWGTTRASTILANGQLQNAAQFRQLVVAYRNGAPVHLEELGQVLDDVENNRAASWYNGARSIVLAVQRQPGTNTVAVANSVKDLIESLRDQIPPSVEIHTLYDRSVSIQESVTDVKHTLMLTLVPRRDGDLHLPAKRLGDDHPQPCPADVARRHVRRDVPVRILARQPVADGAHAGGGICGGRRHRDAREHRATHGDGERSDEGRVRRLGGGRVHDSRDDGIPDRGVHSAAVHGWHRRAVCSTSSRSRLERRFSFPDSCRSR